MATGDYFDVTSPLGRGPVTEVSGEMPADIPADMSTDEQVYCGGFRNGETILDMFKDLVYGQHLKARSESVPVALPTQDGSSIKMRSKIAYFEMGPTDPNGETILFIHGFLGSAFQYVPVMKEYAERHPKAHLIAIDLPGHGGSDLILGDNYYKTPDIISEFIRRKHLSNVALVGSSLGGWVSQGVASESPAVKRVLLVSPLTITGETSSLPLTVELSLSLFANPDSLGLFEKAFVGFVGGSVGSPGSVSFEGTLAFLGFKNDLGGACGTPLQDADIALLALPYVKYGGSYGRRWADAERLNKGRGGWAAQMKALFGTGLPNPPKRIPAGIPVVALYGGEDALAKKWGFVEHVGGFFKGKIPQVQLVLLPHAGHAPELGRPDCIADLLDNTDLFDPSKRRAGHGYTMTGNCHLIPTNIRAFLHEGLFENADLKLIAH